MKSSTRHNNKHAVKNKYKNTPYNITSSAYKYMPNYNYDLYPHKYQKRKIKKIKYVKVEQNLKTHSLTFFLTLSIFATFITSFVLIEALTIQKKFEIENLTNNLKEINENNKYLETELSKNLDLKYIENIASSKLKMQKPANHQIIHINVPKESYTIINENINNKNNFIHKFLKILKK